MVDASPALSERILKSGKSQVHNLAHLASGSFFRAVSAEGKGLDGKRVHYAALDEVHEHPNAIVVDKMRAGTKGRRQALIFEITNSGYDRHSVCYQHHEYSARGAGRTQAAERHLVRLRLHARRRRRLARREVWLKVNPNLGVSITRKYLREQVAKPWECRPKRTSSSG
jgi:phage terminase large subunit-like protein